MLNESPVSKKIWTWQLAFQCHLELLIRVGILLLTPLILTPKQIVSIMISIDEVMQCTLLSELFLQLSLIAGIDDGDGDGGGEGIMDTLLSSATEEDPAMYARYGRAFASGDRYGSDVSATFQDIVDKHNQVKGLSAQSMAYFVYALTLTGNTIQAFFNSIISSCRKHDKTGGSESGSMREGKSQLVFEFILTLYYGPSIFILVLLPFIPKLIYKGSCSNPQPVIASIFTFITIAIAISFIIPYGLLGAIVTMFLSSKNETYMPLAPDYTPLNDPSSTGSIVGRGIGIGIDSAEDQEAPSSPQPPLPRPEEVFTVKFHKENKDARIGIRFGTNNKTGTLLITNIRDESLLAGTELRIGDNIVRLNGVEASNFTPKMAASLMSSSTGDMEVMAYHNLTGCGDEDSVGTV